MSSKHVTPFCLIYLLFTKSCCDQCWSPRPVSSKFSSFKGGSSFQHFRKGIAKAPTLRKQLLPKEHRWRSVANWLETTWSIPTGEGLETWIGFWFVWPHLSSKCSWKSWFSLGITSSRPSESGFIIAVFFPEKSLLKPPWPRYVWRFRTAFAPWVPLEKTWHNIIPRNKFHSHNRHLCISAAHTSLTGCASNPVPPTRRSRPIHGR